MFRIGHLSPGALRRGLRRGAIFTILAAGSQAGCTREFYREWANQDVSEAVFEKSRDPRWRLDVFSVEPPAMSRFASPYDPEFPPAPPDDPATEALSPVPQAPDNRLLVPAEGTGYLELLEKWRSEREANDPNFKEPPGPRPPDEAAGSPTPNVGRSIQPPDTASPFAPGTGTPDNPAPGTSGPGPDPAAGGYTPGRGGTAPGPKPAGPSASNSVPNSRTKPSGSTPIQTATTQAARKPSSIPPPKPIETLVATGSKRKSGLKDSAVQRTARRQPPGDGVQQPLPPGPRIPLESRDAEREMSEETRRELERIAPPGSGAFNQEQAAELAGILVPRVPPLNVAQVAGLPRNARPYVVTMQQAFTLALINSRVYQSQLENLYASALTVTLQRFQFEPQFYAGLSPRTAPIGAGFPGIVPANQFLYSTRRSPGGQVSALTLGEVAGVGKLFSSGGQLLMGFANQVVFNFVGKNPIQPQVSSSLPLTFIQPFLRGAGRAVVLESLTQAERSLLYQTRAFAKFRQEFIVVSLTGGTIANFGTGVAAQGFSGGGNSDPTLGFIPVAVNFANVIIDRRNLAYFEQLAALYEELIEGESSGLTKLQVDQIRSNVLGARSTLISDILVLRNQIDQFKQQLGMPPDTPLVPDLSLVQPYLNVYNDIDDWQRAANRKLDDIPKIVNKIPELEDIVLDGRSVLGIYKGSTTYDNEDELEATLQAAVRIAAEYRLDLMNNRAALYDAWRQIRVRANALKGYLDVSITNQLFTPTNTTNPFAFVDQAKQFSLVLRAELPLVRVAERNTFRAAIIAYEQARRTLMSQEDFIKYQLRSDIRGMQVQYINYEITKRNLILNVQLKDQAFEQIIAPPQGGTSGGVGLAANAATQTNNLVGFHRSVIQSEQSLINAFQAYQAARLTVYRDIGTLPYDEWEAFSELFPSEYRGPSLGQNAGTGVQRRAPSEAAQPAQAGGR
ncbi:hypothetical protein [Aquisphaera insulae]|uniref:hypothetical protein n=1 Tax=Aquisphaera insulae TaxID=2712864 RepID=UPI0013EB30F8|nr:hypothetical protein [Aquisphaera insulae]